MLRFRGCEGTAGHLKKAVWDGLHSGRWCPVSDKIADFGVLTLQKWLDPSQDHKAKWLYIWAKEAGLVASRDELAEMLATDSLTTPLANLWKQKTGEQKLVERLCQAAAAGDLTALQV